jgi:hypothetical protein
MDWGEGEKIKKKSYAFLSFFLSFDKKCKFLSTQVYCVCRTKGNPLMQKIKREGKAFPDRNKKNSIDRPVQLVDMPCHAMICRSNSNNAASLLAIKPPHTLRSNPSLSLPTSPLIIIPLAPSIRRRRRIRSRRRWRRINALPIPLAPLAVSPDEIRISCTALGGARGRRCLEHLGFPRSVLVL